MTLAWILAQIEETLRAENCAKNVYDLAMLCICRDEFQRRAAPDPGYAQAAEPDDDKKREAIVLTAHSADLDVVPTIEQIDAALGAVAINTPEERERVKDLRTWRDIIEGSRE